MPRIVLLSVLLALAACTSTPTVVENSATAVTVRYDGIANKLDDATQVAQKVCASHDKIARLRKVNDEGIGQHLQALRVQLARRQQPLLVGGLGQGEDVRRAPGRVEGDGAKRVAKNVTDEPCAYFFCPLVVP